MNNIFKLVEKYQLDYEIDVSNGYFEIIFDGLDEVLEDKNSVITLLENESGIYKLLSPELKNDRDILLVLITNEYSLDYVTPEIQMKNKDIIILYCATHDDDEYVYEGLYDREFVCKTNFIKHASKEIKDDRELMLSVINSNPEQIKYLCTNDKEIATIALKESGTNMKYLSSDLQNDREFIEENYKEDMFPYLSDSIRNDKSFLLSHKHEIDIIHTNYCCDSQLALDLTTLKGFAPSICGDKDIVKEILSHDPTQYKYVFGELKEDPDIAMLALHMFDKFSDKLKSNKKIALEAVKHNVIVYKNLDDELICDTDILNVVLNSKNVADIALSLPRFVFDDRDVALKLLNANKEVYLILPQEYKDEEEFVMLALTDTDNLVHVDQKWWTPELITKAIIKSPFIMVNMPKYIQNNYYYVKLALKKSLLVISNIIIDECSSQANMTEEEFIIDMIHVNPKIIQHTKLRKNIKYVGIALKHDIGLWGEICESIKYSDELHKILLENWDSKKIRFGTVYHYVKNKPILNDFLKIHPWMNYVNCKEMTGKEFNEICGDIILLKYLKDDMKMHNFQYKEGLNVDTLTFNPYATCSAGGLYFSCEQFIEEYEDFGQLLYRVTIPDDAKVIIESDDICKADRIVLSPYVKK